MLYVMTREAGTQHWSIDACVLECCGSSIHSWWWRRSWIHTEMNSKTFLSIGILRWQTNLKSWH